MKALTNSARHPVLVVCADPILYPEATHIAAACGLGTIATTDPVEIARHRDRASAVLVDAPATPAWSACSGPARGGVFFLAPDPGPVNPAQVVAARAESGFVLPAQAAEVLRAVSRYTQAPAPTAQQQPRRSAAGVVTGVVIGVCGVVGGAGASTLAAALAAHLAPDSVLVDADPCSGGADLLLGVEDTPGARWPDLHLAEGATPCADLVAVLPATSAHVPGLSAARSTVDTGFRLQSGEVGGAVETLRQGVAVTVVDFSARTPDAAEMADLCDHVVVLIPAEVRAGAAAGMVLRRLRRSSARLHLVAVNRGWSSLSARDVERLVQVPVEVELRQSSRVARGLETRGLMGSVPGALKRPASELAALCGVAS